MQHRSKDKNSPWDIPKIVYGLDNTVTTHFPCLGDTQLADILAGGVSTSEWTRIDLHIDECPSCRDLVAAAALSNPNAPNLSGHIDEAPRPVFRPISGEAYVLGEEIGSGGMGSVVSGWDTRLMRPVAIKTLTTNASQDVHRFEREAVVGARLQHPGIVPVYDAAELPSGQRLIAMKLVRGRSLAEVVLATEQLPDRLALLTNVLVVADAIAYAHSQGVVHRDLKPSNVMLGNHGETIVVDWGLALLTGTPPEIDEGSSTLLAQGSSAHTKNGKKTVVGTPSFMAAEQARGDTVDERADVYGLGALLYFALAKTPPNSGSSNTEILRSASTGEVESLNKVMPGLPNDLVTLVERAMEPSREDRYRSAIDFAADLRRFLAGKLVSAHPYTRLDRVARWAQRNRSWVVAGSLALILAIGGGLYSVRRIVAEKRQAEVERKLAEESRADAETFMDFMLFDVFNKLEPIGQLPLLEDVAREASDYYQQRPKARTSDDQNKRATALRNLGDVLLKRDAAMAMTEYRASLAIWEKLVAQDRTNASWQRDLAVSHNRVGTGLLAQGNTTMAMTEYRASLIIREKLAAQDPTNASWQRDLAVSHERVGNALLAQGNTAMAMTEYRSALGIQEKLAAQDPTNVKWQRDLAINHERVGIVLVMQGDTSKALGEYQASLTIREKLTAQDPTNASWQDDLAVNHGRIGNVLMKKNDAAMAMAAYQASLTIRAKLAAQDPTNASWQDDLAASHEMVGKVLLVQGNAAIAMAEYRSAIAIRAKLTAQDPTNARWQRGLSVSHNGVGNAFMAQGDAAIAMAEYRASQTIAEELAAQDPTNTAWQDDLAVSHTKVGDVLVKQGDAAMAMNEYQSALAIQEKLAAQDPTNAVRQRGLAVSRERVGTMLLAQGNLAMAMGEYRASLTIREKLAAQDPTNAGWQRDLSVSHYTVGNVLVKQGDMAMAVAEYQTALAILEKLAAQDPTNAERKNDVSEVRDTVANCCKEGRP